MPFCFDIDKKSIEHYTGMITRREPFAFSRWGDGEWMSIVNAHGERSRNTDGHQYFPEMGEALREVLESNPNYMLATRANLPRRLAQAINRYADETLKRRKWYCCGALHHAWGSDSLYEFMHACATRDLVVVGPPAHSSLCDLIADSRRPTHVECPLRDSWLSIDDVYEVTLRAMKPGGVCWVSMGMPAGVIIDRLYRIRPDCTFIDTGSAFDAFTGRGTRSGWRRVLKKHNVLELRKGYLSWRAKTKS